MSLPPFDGFRERHVMPTIPLPPLSSTLPTLPLTVELLFESSPDCAKVLDLEGNLLAMNHNGRCLMEVDHFSQVCGQAWPTLWPEQAAEEIKHALGQARQGEVGQFVSFCPTAKGTPKWWDVRVTPIHDAHGQLQGFLSVSRDITALQSLLGERERKETFAQGQKMALEQAVLGAPLREVLTTLARTAESYADSGMLASILLLDETETRLHLGAAPSLPEAYNRAIDGMEIGPMAGSCGTAAFRKEAVFAGDIASDPAWEKFRALAAVHGFGSSWSYPILSSAGKVLGTFAFYYRDRREPSSLEREAMPVLVHTAALVLERHHETRERIAAEAALREARTRLDATLAAGEVATWIYDIRSNRVVGDRNFNALFGLSPEDEAGCPDAVCGEVIHPDDLGMVKRLIQRAIATGQPYEAAYRIRTGEGHYQYVIARGKVQYDEQGQPTVMPGVVLDITRQKQAEEELRHVAAKLSETNQRKTEFLATLAHELRNPLAPIRNGLEVMRLAGSNPSAAAKVLDMMARQVDHMVHLIDDLLDMARVDSGKIELKKGLVDLKTVAAGAVEASLPLIDAAHHALEVCIPDEPLPLDADATRLTQVLTNLLGNAAKYTPNGGRIRLAARRDGGEVAISVCDTGIGIPEDALDSIFDMFSQVERSMGRSQGGLGIGLSLVSRLVQMHGGTVSAASPGEGKGSTFTVRLPLVVQNHLESDAHSHPGARQGGQAQGASAQPLRIVVADDNTDAAESMASVLRITNHDVSIAKDGHEALKLIEETRPDVVFLDIGMPGLTGHEVAQLVRKTRGMEHSMLVALTGWGTEQDRARSMEAGFDHHLIKPASMGSIDALLRKAHQRARAGQYVAGHNAGPGR